jgi:hypothetical protein
LRFTDTHLLIEGREKKETIYRRWRVKQSKIFQK